MARHYYYVQFRTWCSKGGGGWKVVDSRDYNVIESRRARQCTRRLETHEFTLVFVIRAETKVEPTSAPSNFPDKIYSSGDYQSVLIQSLGTNEDTNISPYGSSA